MYGASVLLVGAGIDRIEQGTSSFHAKAADRVEKEVDGGWSLSLDRRPL